LRKIEKNEFEKLMDYLSQKPILEEISKDLIHIETC